MSDDLLRMIENTGGFFRPNRYRVDIDLPDKLRGDYQEHIKTIGLTCSVAALPGKNLDVKEVTQGNSRLRPHASNVTATDFRFYIGKNLIVRKMFLEWMNLVVDHNSRLVGFEDEYAGQFRIYPMGRSAGGQESNQIEEVILYRAFPETVGQVILGYDESNQIAMLNVSVKYPTFDAI